MILARAFLSRITEPASIPVWDWVRRHGPVAAAESIQAGDVPPDVAHATAARRTAVRADDDLAAAERHGIRLVVPEGPEWPHFAFSSLEAVALTRLAAYRAGERTHRPGGELIPPLALWARGSGDLSHAAVRAVAIVGSRSASSYGEHVTAELAFGLARQDVVVVSGGAFGIDATAHRSALAAEGSTTIVSAGGIDRPYPSSNAMLFERAEVGGLVVSESPPGSAPHRHRFLTRNRLIAALSTGTVVTEAAARSGALNTAAHCIRLGRPLMAVPGPVTSAMSVGLPPAAASGSNAGVAGYLSRGRIGRRRVHRGGPRRDRRVDRHGPQGRRDARRSRPTRSSGPPRVRRLAGPRRLRARTRWRYAVE